MADLVQTLQELNALGVGFVSARKPGKLPHETVSVEYGLEYGVDQLQMHADAVAGSRPRGACVAATRTTQHVVPPFSKNARTAYARNA